MMTVEQLTEEQAFEQVMEDELVTVRNPWGSGTIQARAPKLVAATLRQERDSAQLAEPKDAGARREVGVVGRIDCWLSSHSEFCNTLADALGCDVYELDSAALAELTTLNLSGRPIEDITPICHLRSLRNLNLSNTQVKTVLPLATLGHIEWLDLSYTRVRDITPLRKLLNLRTLYVSHTAIETIAHLEVLQPLSETLRWVEAEGIAIDDGSAWVRLGRSDLMEKTEFVIGRFTT